MSNWDFERMFEEEKLIVDRCWAALGVETYGDADGKSIYELIRDMKTENKLLTARFMTTKEKLEELVKKWEARIYGQRNCIQELVKKWEARIYGQRNCIRVSSSLECNEEYHLHIGNLRAFEECRTDLLNIIKDLPKK